MAITTRSISLPTRLRVDPNWIKIQGKVNKLKGDWECPRATSGDAILSGLAELVELYNSTQELSLRHKHINSTSVEEALDASIGLLDACGAAREVVLRSKESAESLLSSLRRKCNIAGEADLNAYSASRKGAKREIGKALGALMKININTDTTSVAISIFRSLFLFLSLPATHSKWSFVANYLLPRSSDKELTQVASVDAAVCSLRGQLRSNTTCAEIHVHALKQRLEALHASIHALEAVLETLFKCLIQHRVSLLNLITP